MAATESAGGFDLRSTTSAELNYSAEATRGLPLLVKEISDIYSQCRVADWDGEGAAAIPLAAYMQSLQLLSRLPTELPLPSAHPDPDGYINLEWYFEKKTFSMLIGARPMLFWAGYYSDDRRRSGREPFEGVFPNDLVIEIKKVYA